MKSSLLLMSMAGVVLSSAPAQAAKLLSWQFDSNNNKLNFATDAGVQPSAQLISNPSRLVIDVPGTTLDSPTASRQLGGSITSVRVGQFQANTTRLVVELAPGHTIDPQKVKFVGKTSNQWSVQLPTPTRIANTPVAKAPTPANTSDFQVTQNGFYLRLSGGEKGNVQVRRTSAEQIEIDLEGINLPASLVGQNLDVKRYGVNQAQFTQTRLTLKVHPQSPNWTANLTRSGSLVIVPDGDMTTARRLDTPPSATVEPVATTPRNQPKSNEFSAITIPVPPPLSTIPATFPVESPSPTPRNGSPSTPIPKPPAPRTVPTPAPAPRPTTPSSSIPRIPNSRILVSVDPGHGGKDPGAIGIGGLREKDVVLDISRRVASILQQQGAQVQLTRSNDSFVTLTGRASLANQAGADVFVSIHANAVGSGRSDVNGVETFHHPSSSRGRQLAQSIQSSILQSINMRNRGVKSANFSVLRNTSMPAALVEVGFVTGRSDASKLKDPAFRQQMATAIARGVINYIR